MNNIQKLINELEEQKIKSQESILPNNPFMTHANASADGEVWAFDLCIQKLKLLLSDKHTGAITEAAHLANTVLGEVCPHCGHFA